MPKPLPTPAMTKAQGLAFRERWRLAYARAEEELRDASIALRWKQFNSLMRMGRQLGWTEQLANGVDVVRQRWAKIREAHRRKTG